MERKTIDPGPLALRKTIAAWCDDFGVDILDPDGFDRGPCPVCDLGIVASCTCWSGRLYTLDEFRAGMALSTIRPRVSFRVETDPREHGQDGWFG